MSNEIRPFTYSYTMPKGKKQFYAIAHGITWEDAKENIRRYHPKRSNIKRE